MAGCENRINANLEDVYERSPKGWGWKMMETCACAEYKKPELTVIAFTTNHSVSACSSYYCLLGSQDASNAETIGEIWFTVEYTNGTTYIVWYYDYGDSTSPADTYMDILRYCMQYGSNGTYYQNTTYGYESTLDIYKNWHIAVYDNADVVSATPS